MMRTQIQLPADDHRRLKEFAHRRGISLAEAVRRGVAALLAQEAERPSREELVDRFLSVAGRHRDPEGATGVAERHDDYLAEAYAERRSG